MCRRGWGLLLVLLAGILACRDGRSGEEYAAVQQTLVDGRKFSRYGLVRTKWEDSFVAQ